MFPRIYVEDHCKLPSGISFKISDRRRTQETMQVGLVKRSSVRFCCKW